MNRSLCLWLLGFALAACKGQGAGGQIEMRECALPACEAMSVCDSLQIPQVFHTLAWEVDDSVVSFVSRDVEDLIVSFRLPSCELKHNGVHIGQGPDELITLNAGKAQDRHLLLYDIMSRKLRLYDAGGDSLQLTRIWPLYNDEEGMCKPFTFVTQLSDEAFLMKVDGAEVSCWEIADLKKGVVLDSYVNPCRKAESTYTPFTFVQSVSDTLLFVAYEYMDYIEYYSLAGNRITPLFAMGHYEDYSDVPDYEELKICHVDVDAFGGRFYCLNSDEGFEWGRVVEVYNGEGKCEHRYVLPLAVSSIRLDGQGNLWGYVEAANCTMLYKFGCKVER